MYLSVCNKLISLISSSRVAAAVVFDVSRVETYQSVEKVRLYTKLSLFTYGLFKNVDFLTCFYNLLL